MKALDQILYWASVNYHPLYEQYLVEEYEKENGPHFDEKRAKDAVCKMHHMEDDEVVKGEHWTVAQVKDATAIFKQYLPVGTTDWDVYVAVHMWWHDLGRNYERRNEEDALIEDAITWSFMDEDGPEGKIWRYVNAMA